jgi:hypothetical protein
MSSIADSTVKITINSRVEDLQVQTGDKTAQPPAYAANRTGCVQCTAVQVALQFRMRTGIADPCRGVEGSTSPEHHYALAVPHACPTRQDPDLLQGPY